MTDGVHELKHGAVRRALFSMATHELCPGDALPGERVLESRFGVSRITIRRAIADLCAEGVLVRVHGKGTFVSHGQIQSSLHLASFNEDMRQSGIEPTTHVLIAAVEVPPARAARFLGLGAGEVAHHVKRLRQGNRRPVSIDDCWLPVALTPELLTSDLTSSLYRALSAANVPVIRAHQTVAADAADEDIAALLDVPSGSPVLVFERESVTMVDGLPQPIEFCISTYRADRYKLFMTLEEASAPV
jgi:GntR family transcriptional regulator